MYQGGKKNNQKKKQKKTGVPWVPEHKAALFRDAFFEPGF
jgi:hypothetical protein